MIIPSIHLPIDSIITDTTKLPQQKPPSKPATTRTPPSPSKPSPAARHLIPPYEQLDEDDHVLNKKIPEKDQIQAMEEANKNLSKCKNDLHTKKNPRSQDSWLMHTIKKVIKSTDRVINPHKYKFQNSRDAAKFNTKILKRHKYDFKHALKQEAGTMLEPGSEFRTHNTIEQLFQARQL